MQLENFFSEIDGSFEFSREQASQFAKQVAQDFNPIHDTDAKRFCVPGDLLFSVALRKLGLRKKMDVLFSDMVGNDNRLHVNTEPDKINVIDDNEKLYLTISFEGDRVEDIDKINAITREYVAFSGKTFPHILVPLWKENNVMVNPNRPMVIYQSMSLLIHDYDFSEPTLRLTNSSLDLNGKRGNVCFNFNYEENGKVVASGEKHMILSGLRPYEQSVIDDLVTFYNERKLAK